MKPFILFLLFLIVTVNCFAQSKCNIKKAYAFYNVSMPGTQMADENGILVTPKPNITRFIYVEYGGTIIPDIKTVHFNDTELSFSIVKVAAMTVSIGDEKLILNNSITAKKGNRLLKIDLQPLAGKTMPDGDCKTIVIKSKQGCKLCKFYVSGEKQFSSLPSY